MPGVRINGKQFDPEDLTLDEVAELEEALDAALEDVDFRRAKNIKQFVFVVMRRDDPSLTLADIGRVRIVDLLGNRNGNGDGGDRD